MTTHRPPMSFDLLSQVAGDPEMRAIFSERATVEAWLRTEIALAEGQAQLGIIPRRARDAIALAADVDSIDLERLWDETRVVGYPILPLVRQLDELLPLAERGMAHLGATTQDIMDTGLVMQLTRASDYLLGVLDNLCEQLARLAVEHADTMMAARTHAMHAVPTTFGAKLAVYLADFTRHRARVIEARAAITTISLHGAGGTSAAYGDNSPRLRQLVADHLGLRTEDIPWHVSRGRLAEWAQVWVFAIASAARLAREVIDLSRNEIGEVAEKDGHHRGASSTMPQKRNPITSETLVGNSIIAGALSAAVARIMEPGHERSAGEWQAEWFLFPHLAALAASSLTGALDLVSGLRVNDEQMRANLEVDYGLLMAEAYMIGLAPSLGREHAHDIVYEAARCARAEQIPLRTAMEKTVPVDQRDSLQSIGHTAYVGEAKRMVDVAVAAWAAATAEGVSPDE
jgi:3-carboxy-cis,cis-muconate cycloisomerase